jgi:sortase B
MKQGQRVLPRKGWKMDRGRSYRQTPAVRKRLNRRRLLIAVLCMVLLLCIAELVAYAVHSRNNQAREAELATQHEAALLAENQAETSALAQTTPTQTPWRMEAQASAQPLPTADSRVFFQTVGVTRSSLRQLVRRNSDVVGWLTIEDVVAQPIVYRNNTFYLNHDFDRNVNACGAVFLDVNHPLRASTQNLLLYGHNMKDGSIFGKLQRYLDNNYLHSHFQATLETRFETFTYLIFAVDKVSTDQRASNFLYFWGHPSFRDGKTFSSYIDEVYRHSLYTRYLDVEPSDTLLTLSTCFGDDRLVLFARRQRADETEADIQRSLLGLYRR